MASLKKIFLSIGWKFRYFNIRILKILYSIFVFKSLGLLIKGILPSIEHKELFTLINSKCDSIIDVGLNRGQFSLIASNLISEIPIFAFEPINNIFIPFSKYFRYRFPSRYLNIYTLALSDSDNENDFYITQKTDCSSFLEPSLEGLNIEPKFLKVQKKVVVKTKKLDDVLLENMKFKEYKYSLLKIDTQGSELLVLNGARNLLKTKIKFVYVEVSDLEHYKKQTKSNEIIDFLYKYGFVLVKKFNLSYNKRNVLAYGDFLFQKLN